MSANMNLVILAGNLTRDPELRYIPSGQAVTTFSMAMNRVYNDDSGNKKETVTFIRVVAWGKLAEICNEYLKKGSSALIQGRLDSRQWEKDGVKRTSVEVIASAVQFLSPKTGGKQTATAAANHTSADPELQPDDEIPF